MSPPKVLEDMESITLNPGDALPSLPPGTLRLYNMRFCPYAQRTVLTLAKKGLPCEVVNVNLKDKPAWFLERNPLGKVPTIEHDGKSDIVNQYLDEVFSQNPILPADPVARAEQKMICTRLDGLTGALYAMFRATPETLPAVTERLQTALQNAEGLLKADFYGGSSPGYADYFIWPFLERMELYPLMSNTGLTEFPPGGSSKYPKLAAYLHRMKQTPEANKGA